MTPKSAAGQGFSFPKIPSNRAQRKQRRRDEKAARKAARMNENHTPTPQDGNGTDDEK